MNTLTLKDIAKKIDKPATTVRYWANQFADYLKPYKPENGRFPLYGQDDLIILTKVKKHYDAGKSTAVILQLLADEYGEVIRQQKQDDDGTTAVQQPNSSQETSAITTMARLQNEWQLWHEGQQTLTDSYKRQCDQQTQRIQELEKELAKHREKAEKLQTEVRQLKTHPIRRSIFNWINQPNSGNDTD